MSTLHKIITFDYAIAVGPCPHYTSYSGNQTSHIIPLPVGFFRVFYRFTLLISWSPLYSCCHLPALCCIIPTTLKFFLRFTSHLTDDTLCLMTLVRSLLNRFLRLRSYQFLPCQPKCNTVKLHLSGRNLSGSPIIWISLVLWINLLRIL
jgi:hypothetical protein